MVFQLGNKFGCLGKGKKRSPRSKEWRENLSKAVRGKKLSKEHKLKIGKAHKGRKHNWGYKISKALRGKNCCNWKGGITSVNEQIRHSFKYKQWRSDIFKRDNWTCQTCRKRGSCRIEAHHSLKSFFQIKKENGIKTLEQALECKELWDVNNGITLCLDCHNLTKKGRCNG